MATQPPTDRERTLIEVIDQLTAALIAFADADERVARSIELAASPPKPCGAFRSQVTIGPRAEKRALDRCGLLAGHAGRHIAWPSGKIWADPPSGDDPEPISPPCDVSAVPCIHNEPPQPGDCPYTGHDHPRCTFERGHPYNGTTDRHSWQNDGDNRATMDPHAPKPTTYTIPLPPPVGRRVRTAEVRDTKTGELKLPELLWTVQPDGTLTDQYGAFGTWVWVLETFGVAELVELTDDEHASAELYGPVGMRWADPDGPMCPYAEYVGSHDPETPDLRDCALRVGHGGPHRDTHGQVLGLNSIVEGPLNVTPQVAAQTPCTCGRPDQHQPGCPRHHRMSHTPTTLPDPPTAQPDSNEEPF